MIVEDDSSLRRFPSIELAVTLGAEGHSVTHNKEDPMDLHVIDVVEVLPTCHN
jgi:hypothetical protein